MTRLSYRPDANRQPRKSFRGCLHQAIDISEVYTYAQTYTGIEKVTGCHQTDIGCNRESESRCETQSKTQVDIPQEWNIAIYDTETYTGTVCKLSYMRACISIECCINGYCNLIAQPYNIYT